MPERKLNVVFEGLDTDNQDLRLRVFAKKLDDLKDALRLAGRALEAPAGQDYMITGLKKESPTALDATALDDAWGERVFTSLISGAERLRTAESLPSDFADDLYDGIKRLLSGVGDSFKRINLGFSEQFRAAFDDELLAAIDRIEQSDVVSFGSIKGAVERFNSHGDANYFYLYPRLGRGVRCDFPKDLLPLAAEAVTHNATVTGLLKFHPRRYSPYMCNVREIVVHDDDSVLPALSEMAGIAPKITGDQDTLEFIRQVRLGWER